MIGTARNFEGLRDVCALGADDVDVRRRRGRIEREGRRAPRKGSSELLERRVEDARARAVVRDVELAHDEVVRLRDNGELRRRGDEALPSRRGLTCVVLQRERRVDGAKRIDQASALLERGRAEIVRGAHEKTLHRRRRRVGAAVRAAVCLDHERGRAGGERRGLARPAKHLQLRGRARVGEALVVRRDVGRAERPAEVARRHDVDGARPALREAAGADARDVVAEKTVAERDAIARLLVGAEGRAGADGDDAVLGRRRAERARGPRVTGADDDGDAGRDRGRVGERDRIFSIIVIAIPAEGLVQDVDPIIPNGIFDRLNEVGCRRVAERAEDIEPDEVRARRDAAHADVARARQRVRRVHERADVVIERAPVRHVLRRDRARVAERLGAARRRPRRVTAEVVKAHEHLRAIRTNEPGMIHVQAIGDDADLHALAGDLLPLPVDHVLRRGLARIGVGRAHDLQRLGLEGVAEPVRIARGAAGPSHGGARLTEALRKLDRAVGDDGEDLGTRGDRGRLRRRQLRRERVDEAERLARARLRRVQLREDRRVRLRDRGAPREAVRATAHRRHLVTEHDDHVTLAEERLRQRLLARHGPRPFRRARRSVVVGTRHHGCRQKNCAAQTTRECSHYVLPLVCGQPAGGSRSTASTHDLSRERAQQEMAAICYNATFCSSRVAARPPKSCIAPHSRRRAIQISKLRHDAEPSGVEAPGSAATS